jgi:hypothetical protein
MGRNSKQTQLRGTVLASESPAPSSVKYFDYEKIPVQNLPVIDSNGNFVWNTDNEEKEKLYPTIFEHEKRRVYNTALNLLQKHADKDLLTNDDANNLVRTILYKNGFYVNGIEHAFPNPIFKTEEYGKMLNSQTNNALAGFMKMRVGDMYKFFYGMARGRERLDNKMKLLEQGKRVPVTNYDGENTKWLYKNKYAMTKTVIDNSNNRKFKAVIMPLSSRNAETALGNQNGKRSERMKVAVISQAGNKIMWEKILPTFNSNTTGSHAAFVDIGDKELINSGYR